MATLPKETGKTYIASLLAFHQIDRGKRVAVVTCRNFLVTQFNRKLGDLRQELDILVMAQALIKRREYDTFIIYEADEYLIPLGAIIDGANEIVVRFWDLMEKITFLLTATAGLDLEDILLHLFGVEKKQFIDFSRVIKEASEDGCLYEPHYSVSKIRQEHHEELTRTILSEAEKEPVFVYIDTLKAMNMVKGI